jgi:subtilisin
MDRRSFLVGAGGLVAGFAGFSLYEQRHQLPVSDETPDYSPQQVPWGIDRIGAPTVHSDGTTGRGATVAVVGTGIDGTHRDLRPNVDPGVAIGQRAETGNEYPPWHDTHGHGTHMAGIVAAVDDNYGVVGVAPEAKVRAIRVFDKQANGSAQSIVDSIEWAIDSDVDVINLSLKVERGTADLRAACRSARKAGIPVVAAAGNTRGQTDHINYPARYDSVIAVGAVTDDESVMRDSMTGEELDLFAPGANVLSTVPNGFGTHSGTSAGAAHVSGAVALLTSSGLDPLAAGDRLVETAKDLDSSSNIQGTGLLDVAAAFEA